MSDFYRSSYSDFLESNLFDYWLPYCIHFYTWFIQLVNICTDSLSRLTLQGSLSIILTSFHRADGFPFSSIYGPPYPTFQFHLVLLLFDVLLALLFVGSMSRLCILYYNHKGWSTHSSWSCWILLVAWHGRDASGELSHLWICPDVTWTTYLLDLFA